MTMNLAGMAIDHELLTKINMLKLWLNSLSKYKAPHKVCMTRTDSINCERDEFQS